MFSAKRVTIRFGGLTAVNQVSLDIHDGKVTALIGPNGAGKTTFFNIISGVYTPNEGEMTLDGKNLVGLKPYQIMHEGMARTYQVINLFREMTAAENVMVGMHTRLKCGYFAAILRTRKQRAEEAAARVKALEWLDFVGLKNRASDNAGSLSYGDQRKLEIARALASDPKVLLLDEPAAGMNSSEKEELNLLLKKIVALGVSVLIIEHDMKLIMGIADYIYVLNYGRKIAEGTPSEIQSNPEVIKAYLGGE